MPGRTCARALAVLALGWAAFWWHSLTGEELLYVRDLSLLAGPLKGYLASRLAAGDLPLWTPMVAAGMPALADPANQVLYPGNVVFLLAPSTAHANTWFALLHSAGGMLGCFCLLRALGLGRAVSVWGAALYAVSGYVVSITDNMTYLPAVAWVPLGLAAGRRAFDAAPGARGAWTVAAAACVAAILLAGDPLNSSLLGAVLILQALAGAPSGRRRDRVAVALGAVLLGGTLAAVQVLPALSLLAWSERGAGLESAAALQWSLPPLRVLELVRPYPFGSHYPGFDYLADVLYPDRSEPWAASVYVGLLPVILAGVGLADRGRWTWGLVAAGSLAAALGRHLPYVEGLHEVAPWLFAQRYPEKFLFWTTLALVVLAASGAQTVIGAGARARGGSPAVRLAGALGLTAVVVVGLAYLPSVLVLGERGWTASLLWSRIAGTTITHVDAVLAHASLASLVLGGWWVLGAGARRRTLPLVLALGVLDPGWIHLRTLPTAPPALALPGHAPRVAAALGSGHEPARIYFDPRSPGFEVRYRAGRIAAEVLGGLASPRPYQDGYMFHYRTRYYFERLTPAVGLPFGIAYLNGEFSPVQPAYQLWWEQGLSSAGADIAGLLARAGVGWVLTGIEPRNPQWDAPGLREVHRDDELNVRVLQVAGVAGRYRLVGGARGIGDPPRDPGEAVEAAADSLPHPWRGPLTELAATSVIDVRAAGPDRHDLVVHAPADGAHLVLTESYFPGWEATVNGVPTPIRLADRRFVAVAVPGGRAEVTLAYRPRAVRTGGALSIAGLLVAGCILGLHRRGRGRAASPARAR